MALWKLRVGLLVLAALFLGSGCSEDSPPTAPGSGHTARNVNLAYEIDYLDLDTDSVETPPPFLPSAGMDLVIAYNSNTPVHGRVFQERTGREIAHLIGRRFEFVIATDADTATFTASLIDQPFGTDRTILVKTEVGAVYKLGNPVETANPRGVTFDYAKLKDGP